MAAPIIPAVNDGEIETILTRAYAAGAREAGYVALRLPLELRESFREWLAVNFPDKLKRAITLTQSMHGGKDYESQWGRRMAGSGPYAWMIGRRFEIAAKRLGYRETPLALRSDLFRAAGACRGGRAAAIVAVLSRAPRRSARGAQGGRILLPFALAQLRFAFADVVARARHDVLALGELDVEHHVAVDPEGDFRADEIELPHPTEALVVDRLHLVAMGEEAARAIP